MLRPEGQNYRKFCALLPYMIAISTVRLRTVVESACVFADGACIQVSLYLFSTSNARRKMFIEGRHHLALLVLNKYSNCAFSKKSFFKYSCLDVDRPDSPKGTVGVLVQYKQRKKKDVH